MTKNVFHRLLAGFWMGVVIGYFVNLCISTFIGNGAYLPVMPQMQSFFSTQIKAVWAQTFLTGLIGIAFAEAGLAFGVARWGFLKQCLIHFLSTAPVYIPFVVFCWYPTGWKGAAAILGNVLFTYILNFVISYRLSSRAVRKINEKLEKRRECNPYGGIRA